MADTLKAAATGAWTSPSLNKDLATTLYAPADDAPQRSRAGRPGIFYLKNLASQRAGTESDESIIADLLKDGYLVLVIDYAKDPKAVAPYMDLDIRAMRSSMGGSKTKPGIFGPQRVDGDHTYVLAEGFRLVRDILYYGSEKDGYRLDIRYPSKPKTPAPALILNPCDNKNRMGNWVITTYNEVIVESAMTRGYAAVQIDNPVKFYKGRDPMPEVAIIIKAAIRTVRAKGKDLGLSGKVGLMGFSRGSGQSGLAGLSSGMKELEQGPNLDQSSRPDALLLHAGRMDHLLLLKTDPKFGSSYGDQFGDPVTNRKKWEEGSAAFYVTKDDPPVFLSVGGNDEYRVAQIKRMDEALTAAGVEHTLAITPGMGHRVTGDVTILGQIYDFFDKHLKSK
ncbi:MAG: prolyl oligopeptidase family serine peptidase [Planctomycetaceae bacterium]|nr:prolyl oligopeptidase family serine peptidase [Planctomycetaceae bacterium]